MRSNTGAALVLALALGAVSWTVDGEIAYGGILRQFERTDAHDMGLQGAVATAVEHLQNGSLLGWCVAGSTAVVSVPSKHLLQFTRDGETPYVHTSWNNKHQPQKRLVRMGVTYFFDLALKAPAAAAGASVRHRMVVTRDRDKKYSVLSHNRLDRAAGRLPTMATAGGTCDGEGCNGDETAKEDRLVILGADGQWTSHPTDHANHAADRAAAIDALLDVHAGPVGRVASLTPFEVTIDATAHCGGEAATTTLDDTPDGGTNTNADAAAGGSGALTILTYNIWNINKFDDGTYWARLDKLAAQIMASGADVVALQEVRHDAMRDSQPASLARRLRRRFPDWVFQPAMSYPEQTFGRVEEGCAVFSRYPIRNSSFLLLPRSPDRADVHQRALLHAEVATPRGPFNVFVTHLSLSEKAREDSVLAAYAHMQRFEPPMAIMGDLNAEPAEAAMRFLNGNAVLEGVSTEGFADAWLALHPEPQKPPLPATEDDFDDDDDATDDDEDDDDSYADLLAGDGDDDDEVNRDGVVDPVGDGVSKRKSMPGPLWTEASRGMTFSALGPDLQKRIDYIFLHPGTAMTLQTTVLVPELVRQDLEPASDHVGVMVTVEDRRSLTGVDTP